MKPGQDIPDTVCNLLKSTCLVRLWRPPGENGQRSFSPVPISKKRTQMKNTIPTAGPALRSLISNAGERPKLKDISRAKLIEAMELLLVYTLVALDSWDIADDERQKLANLTGLPLAVVQELTWRFRKIGDIKDGTLVMTPNSGVPGADAVFIRRSTDASVA